MWLEPAATNKLEDAVCLNSDYERSDKLTVSMYHVFCALNGYRIIGLATGMPRAYRLHANLPAPYLVVPRLVATNSFIGFGLSVKRLYLRVFFAVNRNRLDVRRLGVSWS